MYASGITYTPVSSTPGAPPTVTGANNGLSMNGTIVTLGEPSSGHGHPGELLYDTDIPLNDFILSFSGLGEIRVGASLGMIFSQIFPSRNVLFIVPANNVTGTGLPGQFLPNFDVRGIYAYSDASSGFVIDYASDSTFEASTGSVTFAGFYCGSAFNPSSLNTSTGDFVAFYSNGSAITTSGYTGNFRGFYHNIQASTLASKHIALETVTGDVYLNSAAGTGAVSGRAGFHNVTTPTAFLHIGSSGGGVGDAPLKLTAGTLTAIAETGAIEYDAVQLYFTPIGSTRLNVLCGNDLAAAPATTAGVVITNFYGTSATNFLGTPVSWASVEINSTMYKIPLYT
jgi:hypothetical protein